MKFVILATHRSGSTTLLKALTSQGINVANEPFNHTSINNYCHSLLENGKSHTINNLFQNFDGIKQLCGQGLTTNGRFDVDNYLIKNYKSIKLKRKDEIACCRSLFLYLKEKYKNVKEEKLLMNSILSINNFDVENTFYFEDVLGENWFHHIEKIFQIFDLQIKDWNLIEKTIIDGRNYHRKYEKNDSFLNNISP